MLQQSLKAKLPLIVCHTTDTINAQRVITYLAGTSLIPIRTVANGITAYEIEIGGDSIPDYLSLLQSNEANEQTTIVVNPSERIPVAFDAGEIPVPKKLVRKLMQDFMPANQVPDVVPTVSGLTLREVSDVCRLSQAAYGTITVESITALRGKTTATVPGVLMVNTALGHYEEEASITHWAANTGSFLLREDVDARLRPRGLLMSGEPGTGKTLSSKYLAERLNIPLYRLDVGAIQSKYVGESEANLKRALDVISRNSPCIMLIDEVEKLFNGTDDSGVTANLLAGLLWWLQEHDCPVLTVMTTNNLKALPSELIRPGRIDRVFNFEGVQDWKSYIESLIGSLGVEGFEYTGWLNQELQNKGAAQADLTKAVLQQARDYILNK